MTDTSDIQRLEQRCRRLRQILMAVVIVACVLQVISLVIIGSLWQRPDAHPTPPGEVEPEQESHDIDVDASPVTFEQIRQSVSQAEPAQRQAYEESLRGKKISWDGYVEEVRLTLSGVYEVFVDMDPPESEPNTYDVVFEVPEATALALKKDQHIQFTGVVWSVVNVVGSCKVQLMDAIVQ